MVAELQAHVQGAWGPLLEDVRRAGSLPQSQQGCARARGEIARPPSGLSEPHTRSIRADAGGSSAGNCKGLCQRGSGLLPEPPGFHG